MRAAARWGAAALLVAACGGGTRDPGGERITALVVYEGASAEVVERSVVDRVEQVVGKLDQVTGLRSVAGDGIARVEVTFRRGVDPVVAAGAVREALAGELASFPADIDPPMVRRSTPRQWLYATFDGHPDRARALVDELERIPGVMQVETCGDRRSVVALDLSPEHLAARGLTAADVADVIRAQNISIPGGRIEVGPTQATLRIDRDLSFDAVSTLPIGTSGVQVRDVAVVTNRSQTDCVAVGTGGGVLMRVALHLAKDAKPVAKVLRTAGATVVDGPVTLRDVELPGAVHERADRAQAMIKAGKGGPWFAAVPRDGQRFQLVIAGDPWKGGALAQAVLQGPELARLEQAAGAAVETLRANPRIAMAERRGAGQSAAIRLELDRGKAADLGVDLATLTRTIAISYGERVGSYSAGNGTAFDVVVTVDGGLQHWMDLRVRGKDNALVPLDAVVRAEAQSEPAEILHLDRQRAVVVWAQGGPGLSAGELRRLLAAALPGATVGAVDPRNLAEDHW